MFQGTVVVLCCFVDRCIMLFTSYELSTIILVYLNKHYNNHYIVFGYLFLTKSNIYVYLRILLLQTNLLFNIVMLIVYVSVHNPMRVIDGTNFIDSVVYVKMIRPAHVCSYYLYLNCVFYLYTITCLSSYLYV